MHLPDGAPPMGVIFFFENYGRSTADSFKEEKKAGQYNVDRYYIKG
jgi:hypothetical protein